jgi:hypothetical protein
MGSNRLTLRTQHLVLQGISLVLPLSVVDNSVFSPIRLTVTLDPAYPS